MASQSKGAKKRQNTLNMNSNNPLLVTPKPPSEEDKRSKSKSKIHAKLHVADTSSNAISGTVANLSIPTTISSSKLSALSVPGDRLDLLLEKSVQLNQC